MTVKELTAVANPWLSVIMPTYNGQDYLAAALESVCVQGDSGVEVIAVDDGSSDATLGILEAFAARLPLQVVRRGRVGNWVANSNHGLGLARGEWVCWLHQDDLWPRHRLAALRSVLARRLDAGLVLSPSWYIDPLGRRLGLWRCPLPVREGFLERRLVVERLLVQNFIALPAPIFRREAALQVGGLQENLWYTADWDFWLKLAGGCRTVFLPQPLACFRIHPQSQTIRRSSRRDDFYRQLEVVLEKHLGPGDARRFDQEVGEVARFSASVNTFLAASVHGDRSEWLRLGVRFLSLGPSGWHRFLRDSRIKDRVWARLRAGLNRRPKTALSETPA
jgi:GT2 family glycosyltransferase